MATPALITNQENSLTTTLTRDDVQILNTDLTSAMGASQWHIRIDGAHFIVSATHQPPTGPFAAETMAFRADADGEITNSREVAFAPVFDHNRCIDHLLDFLNTTE